MKRILFLLLTATALFSCLKKNDEIRLSGQGDIDEAQSLRTDTFTVQASTVKEDSIVTSNFTFQLLGAMNDIYTGVVKASVYTPLYLTDFNRTFSGGTNTLDSAVLYIPYVSRSYFYGDTASVQNWDVYEMTEKIDLSKKYTQFSTFSLGDKIGSYSGKPLLRDSVTIRTGKSSVKVSPGLRVKLSSAFATKLFNVPAASTTGQTAFKDYVNGIAIVPAGSNPAAEQGSLVALNVSADRSRLLMYYNDTSEYQFALGVRGEIINTYTSNFTNSDLLNQIANKNATYSTTYAQGAGSCKTWIRIPYLLDYLKTQQMAILKAEIIVPLDQSTVTTRYYAPNRLILSQPDSAKPTFNAPITDILVPSMYRGTYDAINKEYTFGITYHLQEILNDWKDKGLNHNRGFYLTVPSDNPITGARAVIDANNNGRKIRLRITYTKLN